MQPSFDKILLRGFRVCQRIGRVIRIDQIFYDRAGFPGSDACVWVFDYRDTAVGVELFEGRLFEIAMSGRVLGFGVNGEILKWEGKDRSIVTHEFGFVGDFELLKDNGDLPGARTLGLNMLEQLTCCARNEKTYHGHKE
jgi:hypothetical protein